MSKDQTTWIASVTIMRNDEFCGNDVDDDRNYATRVKMLKFLDQIVDWDADEEDKEANGGIEGGDLLYQIPVCIECPL